MQQQHQVRDGIYHYIILIYLSDMHNKQIDIKSHLSPQLSQLRSLINIAQNRYDTTLRLLPLDHQAAQLEPLEINIEIQQAMRDNNINIGDPDYNHNIDILLRSIIDRANLRRSTTSSTTTRSSTTASTSVRFSIYIYNISTTTTGGDRHRHHRHHLQPRANTTTVHNIHIFYYSTSSTTTTSTRTSTTTSQHQHDQQHRITRRCTSRRVRQQQPVHLAVHEDHLLQQQHGSLDWNDHRPQHLLNITSTTTTSSSERRTQYLHQQHRIRHQHHLVHHPRQLHLYLEDRPSTGDHQQHRS